MEIKKINTVFEKTATWVLKNRLVVLLCFLLLVGVSLVGLKKIVMTTSFEEYFLRDDPMIMKTNEFKSVFGNDYYVAVLVKNENIFSHKSLNLIRSLSNELMDSLSYAEKMTSLTDLEFMSGNDEGLMVEQIVPETIPTSEEELQKIKNKAYSKPYLAKRLISKDGTLSWILVKLRPFPEEHEWKKESSLSPDMTTGKEVEHIISKEKYKELSPNAAGMPYLVYVKNAYFNKEMGRLTLYALIACILVMFIVTRSLRGILAPLLTSIAGILFGFGFIGWTGIYVDMPVTMMATLLVFACSIAYNVHIYNFFKTRFVETGKRKESIIEAVKETGWGVLLAGITTIAAMMSFLLIKVVPLRAIGLDTSICLFSVILTCLFITPIFLSFGKDRKAHTDVDKSFEGIFGNFFEKFSSHVLKRKYIIIITAILFTGLCGVGLFKIEPAFDIEKTIGEKVLYAKRFIDLCRTELGTMYSYDVMITFDEEGAAKKVENLRKLEQLEKIASDYQLTKRYTSILEIIKDMNCTLNGGDESYYKIPEEDDMVAQLLLLYENAGGTETSYWIDYEYRRLRLQIEIKNFNSNEVDLELKDIQKKAEDLFRGSHVSAVGNLPQFTVMQQYITKGQMSSMLFSVLVIGLILIFVFGNWKIGLIGMIPNIAPAIIVGGLMGWLNIPLDMMTASLIPMILGVSVDDTIHFINHGKLEFNAHRYYDLAIRKTFRVAGLAVVLSTVIICATFLGFGVSEGIQIKNWGLLSVIGLLSALLADLFLTPVLLKTLKAFGEEEPISK